MSSPRRQNKGRKTQYVGREGHHSSDSCLLLHLRHLEMSKNDGEKFMSLRVFLGKLYFECTVLSSIRIPANPHVHTKWLNHL